MTNDFTVVFSLVMTAPLFISEPVAASVGTVTMGSARVGSRGFCLTVEDHVPGIALVEDGRRHHLGRVHGAAAAQSDDHVAVLAAGDLRAAHDRRQPRVGLDAGALHHRDAGGLQARDGAVERAAALDAAAAGDEQGALAVRSAPPRPGARAPRRRR